MRIGGLLLAFLLAVVSYACSHIRGAGSTAVTPSALALKTSAVNDSPKVDFATHIEPILRSKCQSCHFKGGVMYEKLPFDRPETIKRLGTKLFSRIQNENDRRLIREFLSQS
jgi:hypothetical protein